MRRLLFGAALLAGLWAEARAQEKSVIDKLTIPLEVGISTSASEDLSARGVFFKTCLEYRDHNTHGLWVALEYDEYGFDYKDHTFKGVNATKGSVDCTGVYLGAGYRWALRNEAMRDEPGTWSFGFLVQPGVAFSSMKTVANVSTGTPATYELEDVDFTNFAAKATLQVEYLLNKTFALVLAQDLIQTFGSDPLPAQKGFVSTTSVGFVTFF